MLGLDTPEKVEARIDQEVSNYRRRAGQAGVAAPAEAEPGSSSTNPLPVPAAGQAPVVGKFYKLPDGTVRQWGG